MYFKSLKTRFSIGVVLLFFVGLAAILHVVLDTLQERFQRLIGEDVALLAETHAIMLDSRFDAATQMLQTIAAQTPAKAFDDAGVANAYLGTQSAGLGVFDLGLYIANKDRILMGVNTTDPLAAAKRLGKLTGAPDADYRARERRLPTFSDPYPSPSCNGCPAVALIIPIFGEDGGHRGFVSGALRLDGSNFLASLKDVRIGHGGYFFLLTRSRTMLMHPDPMRIMKVAAKPGQNLIVDKGIEENFEGSGVTVNSTGTKMIVGLRTMKSTGWLLAANFPLAEAEQPFRETRDRVFLLAAVTGFGILALAWVLAQRSLAPLSRLTEHVTHLTNQVEKTPINLQATGEIGMLERAFNDMLAVQEKQRHEQERVDAEIRNLNANLERLVDERTIALANANRELEQTVQSLTDTRQELVEAEKLAALGALVAGIAHELNTPIGNCVLVASRLSDETTALQSEIEKGQLRKTTLREHMDKLDNATHILQRNLDKAAQLIASFKRAAVDRTSDARRGFMLKETLNDTVVMLTPSLKRGHCTVATDIDGDIPMNAYPGSLNQAVSALLENAMIHGYGEPGGEIHLSAKQEGDKVVIVIHDNGAGIAEENLGRVFDPFFTTRFGKGGSGLGLNIVYNIVTGILGGKIRVESRPGQGSTFTLTLPLEAPVAT